MAEGFSPQTIMALAEVVTGGPGFSRTPPIGIYRSGREIVRFFRRLGYDVSLGKTSRVPFTEDLLAEINRRPDGYERILAVIERLLDPRDYVGSEEKLTAVVDHLNDYLKFDGLEIRLYGQQYKLFSLGKAAPVVSILETTFVDLSLDACRQDFERALSVTDSDPAGALTSACSTLESVAKSILDQMHKPYPKDQSIQSLVRAVMQELDLAPEQDAEAEIKRVLGGLANVAAGIGVLRTKYGTAHGRGLYHRGLEPRHAALTVNAASTVSLFLLETYLKRKETNP